MRLDKLRPIVEFLPEVQLPRRRVPFKQKLCWSSAALLIFFVMGCIAPVGISPERLAAMWGGLEALRVVLASEYGTLLTLGIGPIITASIILQLLVGAKVIELDLTKHQDRALFQGTQRFLTIVLALIQAFALMASSHHDLGLRPILAGAIQLTVASVVLMYLDEVVSKWGIGSGIGLFIAGGVSREIFYRAFSPALLEAGEYVGRIPETIRLLIHQAPLDQALIAFWPVLVTVLLFFLIVYGECMRIEIPLALGHTRGIGGRYPLRFFYVSNIPVIFTSILLMQVGVFLAILGSQVQGVEKEVFEGVVGGEKYELKRSELVWGELPQLNCDGRALRLGEDYGLSKGEKAYVSFGSNHSRCVIAYKYWEPLWGDFVRGLQQSIGAEAASTVHGALTPVGIGALDATAVLRILIYVSVFLTLCVVFGKLWVELTGLGPSSIAEQIQRSGLQIPGFRRDKRVVGKVLSRYIPQITVISSLLVGLLAVSADLLGVLGTGTGLLLTVGILCRLHEEIKRERMVEVHPAVQRFLGRL